MRATISSAGSPAAPVIPSPPAFVTAAASSAVAIDPVPAPKIGSSMPISSQTRVRSPIRGLLYGAMSFLTTPDGVRLRITDRGAGDRTIVLVHGWKLSHRPFDHAIMRLAKQHRVVAFDLRGMGESDKPNSRYDFDEHAGDLAFVLEQLGLEDVTLVGWSMGCSVVLQHMQRGGARVGRIVLINGPIKLARTDDDSFPGR